MKPGKSMAAAGANILTCKFLHRLLGRQIWETHVFQRGPHWPAVSDVAKRESAQASQDELVRTDHH
jgi:hypothetical protein